MQVSVTGGTGFIGRVLITRLLESGHNVKVLILRPEEGENLPSSVERIVGDLCSPNKRLEKFCENADILFHCAGQLTNESLMRRIHVDGTKALIEIAKGRIGRWVQLSSIGVYGQNTESEVSEETEPAPCGVYETTKYESDLLLLEPTSDLCFPWSILRPSNVFSTDMPNNSLRQLVSMVRHRLFFYIGTQCANTHYVHVEDVVTALYLCGTQDAAVGRIYNISDDIPLDEFVNTIADSLGQPNPSLHCPITVAKVIAWSLGWLPKFPLTEDRIQALTSLVSYPVTRLESELGFKYTLGVRQGIRNAVRMWHNGKSQNT